MQAAVIRCGPEAGYAAAGISEALQGRGRATRNVLIRRRGRRRGDGDTLRFDRVLGFVLAGHCVESVARRERCWFAGGLLLDQQIVLHRGCCYGDGGAADGVTTAAAVVIAAIVASAAIACGRAGFRAGQNTGKETRGAVVPHKSPRNVASNRRVKQHFSARPARKLAPSSLHVSPTGPVTRGTRVSLSVERERIARVSST